jgi:hypothetical protein
MKIKILLAYAFVSIMTPAAFGDVFLKRGNNGTVSCEKYCANDDQNWGELGACYSAKGISGKYAGRDWQCNVPLPADKSEKEELGCWCLSPLPAPAGSIERHGNNGTISCNAFCPRTKEVCTGGRINAGGGAGLNISCDRTNGHPSNITCYCAPRAKGNSCQKPCSQCDQCADHECPACRRCDNCSSNALQIRNSEAAKVKTSERPPCK